MAESFTNFAKTTLAAGINTTDTAITVTDGSKFPTSDFYIVIGDTTREIVHCSSRLNNVLTADVRGAQGTTAASHLSGVAVVHGALAHHMATALEPIPETQPVSPAVGDLWLDTTDDGSSIPNAEAGGSMIPLVVVTKTDANISLPTVANTWTDVFSDGTSTARPSDVVFPASSGISIGDWVQIGLETVSAGTAAHVFMDMAVVVNGSVVRRTRSNTSGVLEWILPASQFKAVGSSISYQIQSGDFESNGDVRFRLQANNANTTARTLQIASNYYIRLEGRGPLV